YDQALASNAEWIFQCDSDRQTPLVELINFWQQKRPNQIFLGVRANRQDPNERLMVSAFLRFLLMFLFQVSLKDANCPFRLFPKGALKNFLTHIPSDTFAPNIFLSVMSK